ncbi:hypothetical protein ILYODFUR_028112, partial [Ilyodon furcidens]
MSTQSNPSWFGTHIGIGRGSGVLAPIHFSVDSPTLSGVMLSLDEIPGTRVHNLADHLCNTPMPHFSPTSNPTSDSSDCVAAEMRSVIQEMGHQLADSIMSPVQPHNTVAPSSMATQPVANTVSQSGWVADVSQDHV